MISILPLAFGAALYGLAFGVLAAQVGFPWWGVGLMSTSVHAGTSQIVAVDQFAAGSGLLGAVFAGAIMNLRYLGITASVSRVLRALPLWRRLFALHVTSDENWALAMSRRDGDSDLDPDFLIGSGLVMLVTWTVSTSLGAWLGATLPDLEKWGLGFAFTAAFIAMARGMVPARLAGLVPWAVTFVLAVALVRVGLPPAQAIVVSAIFGLVAGVLVRR
ncbi:AzlC family ABC transporter permease [Tepidamorphus sp. 3E244]|uniref:AzlC family ABC transporter permease n=1 Tax=Tepidamorphus sp. 3E244 TaxID=3385498 RepID=UPI0038FBEB49